MVYFNALKPAEHTIPAFKGAFLKEYLVGNVITFLCWLDIKSRLKCQVHRTLNMLFKACIFYQAIKNPDVISIPYLPASFEPSPEGE